MKKLVTLIVFCLLLVGKNIGVAQSTYGLPCTDLYFSEYIEPGPGFSGCKAIEIYNPTNTKIGLVS